MLTSSELIKKVLGLYSKNFRLILSALLLTLLWNLSFAFFPLPQTLNWNLAVIMLVSFLVSAFTEFMLVQVFAHLLQNTSPSLAQLVASTLKRLPAFLTLLIIWALIIMLGVAAFIVPAIIFGVWLIFSSAIFVIERPGLLATFKKSKALTAGYFFPLLGRLALIILLTLFIASAATQGLFTVLDLLTPDSALPTITLVGNVFGAILSALLLPIVTGTIVTLYYEMKRIKGV